MDLARTLKGIAMAGLPNALRAVAYARRRDALERQFAAPAHSGGYETPGRLLEVSAAEGRFRFERAALEVRFLAADLVRLTWTPGAEPVPYALARTEWPEPAVTRRGGPDGATLVSGALAVGVQPDGAVEFRDARGRSVHAAAPPQRRGPAWRQAARLRPGEALYGLGERAARLNLRGGLYRLWNQDAGGIYTTGQDPLYLSIPVYLGQHAAGCYLVFHENTHDGQFDARAPDQTVAEFAGGALRYYIALGSPARVVERYTELTGRPPLPPRWALGYHHALVAYKSEAEILAVARGFRERGLPLSVLHLDLDYMDGYRTFTIDARRFPNLRAISGDLLAGGVRLAAIIDTAVKVDPRYPVYAGGLAAEAFCKLPDGAPVEAPVWPGAAVFPDFTDPQARAWWGAHYPVFLETGILGFWHDMNEPAAFSAWGDRTLPLPTRHALEGRGGGHAEAHNVYALAMNRAGHEALRRLRPQQRPWLLTRAGFAGIQRYAWGWTGDIESTWQGLRQTLPTVLGLGLSGQPYTGPDTGGFHGHPSPELYIRWFQCSAFLPFFRTMAAFTTPRREPWHFGEQAVAVAREFLNLRYSLLPYWYTLAWEAAQTGRPLVRPLFWAEPDAVSLWETDDAFLLGEALLVAPVLEPGARARTLTLPGGAWYSFWTDERHAGPAELHAPAPLDRMPLFVRAGSVLPREAEGALSLHLYAPPPGPHAHAAALYCDSGDGYGVSHLNRFHLRRAGAELELAWEREGDFAFPFAAIAVQVHGATVQAAWVDGAEVEAPSNRVTLSAPCARVLFRCA